MKHIILDSNIVFACLIRQATTHKIVFGRKSPFLFPIEAFDELQEHRIEILKKSTLSEEALDRVIALITSKLTLISSDSLAPFRAEAFELIGSIDPDDVLFFACALAFPGSILWSDDKKLKKQSRIPVFPTKEMMDYLAHNKP